MQQRIEDYKDNFEHEKKNRPMCLLYARRMHLGLRAVQELLMNLVAMSNSSTLSQPASVLKANILYEPEYRELCLTMFNIYQVCPLTQIISVSFFCEKSLIFLEAGKSMTPRLGKHFSLPLLPQQLPRLRLGPLTCLVLCFQNFRDTRTPSSVLRWARSS